MKTLLLVLAFCFFGMASAGPIQDRPLDRAALLELAAAMDIPPDADLMAATQERWLRKPGQERWEMRELAPAQRLFVLDWAAKQGLLDAWKPADSFYDQALILGATTCRMELRLQHLIQLWNGGVRFDQVVWLTGDRPLDPRVDRWTDRCATESEAARLLWEEADLPKAMRNLPTAFIAVPMRQAGPLLIRPNTLDTLVAWMEEFPTPCKALFVSDQPFCGYQFAVVKGALPATYPFDLVGPGVDLNGHPSAAAILLDSLARWIYLDNLQSVPLQKD